MCLLNLNLDNLSLGHTFFHDQIFDRLLKSLVSIEHEGHLIAKSFSVKQTESFSIVLIRHAPDVLLDKAWFGSWDSEVSRLWIKKKR